MIAARKIVFRQVLRAAQAVRAEKKERRMKRLVTCMAMMGVVALSAETLTWTGAESSVWDLTAVNWTNESGVATAWVNGNDALFPTEATSPVRVAGDVELRNLTLALRNTIFDWRDDGGSLTFVSNDANPTNYITLYNESQHNQLSVRVNSAGPLVKQGNSVLALNNSNNNLAGGLFQQSAQLRFSSSGAVGPGVVAMLGNSTAFCEYYPVAPDAKFLQGGSVDNLLGSTGPLLTIKSVGATAENASRVFHIGRRSGECKIALALTRPDSEGIGQYVLHGSGSNFSFDGGVVKAASVARDVFFGVANDASPAAHVTPNGVTFDTACVNTELGLTLTFDKAPAATNVLETVLPTNWSFESDLGMPGWSRNQGQNTGEYSQAQPNNSAFMKVNEILQPDYFTTNGTKFAVVRRGHTISQNVTLPTAGLWRVVYERGCRPDEQYHSELFEVTVSLGGQSSISPAQSTLYRFRREETALFALDAGPATLSFAVSEDSNANRAVFLDEIRLERCEVVPVPVGPFVKTGSGTLGVTNLVTDGLVVVSNGTLAVKESALDGTSVNVAGGTLALYATKLTNATVNVAAGGTLSLRDGDGRNLVVNSSFEENSISGISYQPYGRNTGPRGWTFDFDNNSDWPGIQLNGSDMSGKNGGALTSYGLATAYLRRTARLSQTVTATVDGTYEVSFIHGCRFGYGSYTIPLTFLIDGVAVASNGTRTVNYDFERVTMRVNLTAGDHTLTFSTGDTSIQYSALFIDDVRLTSLDGANELEGNALAFASGATLDLQNAEPIYLAGGVTVDGHEVKGSASALRRAGLIVTGTGEIQIGPPQGTMILFK